MRAAARAWARRWALAVPLLLIALLALAPPALAQPAPDAAALVAEVDAAYAALDYDRAEALARSALAAPQRLPPDALVRLHTTLGLLLHARGAELEAAQQFRAALSLSPTLALDPVLVSPVTLAFFEQVRAAFVQAPTASPEPAAPTYVVLTDPRPAATWRSAVLPGWGQRYKGQQGRGWALTGLWAATLGGGLAAHVQRQRAREAYLAETEPEQVEARFRTYDAWHTARGALFLGATAVWAYAAADALVTGGPEAPDARLAIGPGGAGLGLRVRL